MLVVNVSKGEPAMSSYSDLEDARRYLTLLADLLDTANGGRHWPRVLDQVEFLCRAARGALTDMMWQDHLHDLCAFARALYSDEAHLRYATAELSGVESLRAELLKTVGALGTRLAVLQARRMSQSVVLTAAAGA